MRLTFVITNAPPLVGGLEKVCLRLAQQLVKEGHAVRILGRFTDARHKLAGYFRDTQKRGVIVCEGIEVEVLTLDARAKLLLSPVFKLIWRKATFPLARALYLAAMGKQLRVACAGSDVVHYFGVGREMLGFAAADAARRNNALFCADPAVHPGQWGSFWIDAELFRSADRMFCYSEEENRALRSMGVEPAKIRKVPCGFDFDDSGDGASFRAKHKIEGPVVLFLGRKTEEKGVGRLLAAWPEVLQRFPGATLVFAGPKSALGALGGQLPDASGQLPEVSGLGSEVSGQGAGEENNKWQMAEGGEEKLKAESGKAELKPKAETGLSQTLKSDKKEDRTSELGDSRYNMTDDGWRMAEGGEEKLKAESKGDRRLGMADSKWQMAEGAPVFRSAGVSVGQRKAGRILDLDDLTEGEKQDALAACEVLCVPSEGESFGMVYFEAWAYGKPVVALDLPVLRETIGAADAGILVRKDPVDIARGISTLLGDADLRCRLGANGRRLALGHRWDEAAKHYLQGYAEAMKAKVL